MRELDTTLPIYKQRKIIEESIAKNPITILTAETGAGKSTQVPLWLWKKGKNVCITQPRRIAARSLAQYLAKITRTTLGNEIGFQTGFDSMHSKQTRLLYVTDGVQMIREISGRRHYDVLILDEVHEWNLNQEVLMGVIKRNLQKGVFGKKGIESTDGKRTKRVVIMSATLQADRLSRFLGNAPVISVEGRGFPVSMHHNDPRFLLPDTAGFVEIGRNVLVFQPGKKEILNFMEDLERLLEAEKLKAKILPLHAELSLKDQSQIFEHYKIPKVIVATDIAQTSLTIDDIDAVVDSGLKKELRLVKGIEGLYPVEISRAECLQRAGRAGRVRSGQYILCADSSIDERLPFPDPEIQRLNLESVVLRLINMGLDPLHFPFFHAPAKALIFKAIKRLKLLGALDENEKVTEDGKKMAEFPVSLRSARMLMEAQKGNAKVLDNAVKCIAILETKGILNKDFAGEKFANTPYHSDLLNQLMLWETHKQNRRAINQKKFAMAREIYKELNKRLGINQPVKGTLGTKDLPMLYRALLSCFADEVHEYTNVGADYEKDGEYRQLDRSSVIFETRPKMVTGFPFDLIFIRENRDTGDKEEAYIPLITFASELDLDILDQLKPFSYYKEETVLIEKNKVNLRREFFFGGRLIKTVTSPPKWEDAGERKIVIDKIIDWLEEHQSQYQPLQEKKTKVEQMFNEIKEILKTKLRPFDFYWRGFLYREMNASTRIDDLDMFFNFHSGLNLINLKNLLPDNIIRQLREAEWPGTITVCDEPQEIIYTSEKAYLKFTYDNFEKIPHIQTILPTGEETGIILEEEYLDTWEDAVTAYNTWKKRTVFETKFKDRDKPGHMDDLVEIPFPQPFTGGNGKENEKFEYYVAPRIENDEVFLIHFFYKEDAELYFDPLQAQWAAFVRKHKSKKIENIFKQKGWTVK